MQQVAATDNFRDNLKTALEARKMPKAELARKISSSSAYVFRVLSGEIDPGLDRCEDMANALGLEIRDMLLDPRIFSRSILTTVP